MVPPGTPVPPVGGAVVVRDVVVGALVVVGSVSVAVEGLVAVAVAPESPESSPTTMISAMPSPITKTIRMPMTQRVRVSTPATVDGAPEGAFS